MSTVSKFIQFKEVGGPEVLEVAEREVGQPGPDEVLVRHEAIGINFIDTYHRTGLYPLPLPASPGLEAAGVIEQVGSAVDGWAWATASPTPPGRSAPIVSGACWARRA